MENTYEVVFTVVVHADSAEEAEEGARFQVRDPHFEASSVTEMED